MPDRTVPSGGGEQIKVGPGLFRDLIFGGDQGIGEGCVGRRGGRVLFEPLHQSTQDRFGGGGIGLKVADHHLHRDGVVILMPAVEVGDHAQGGIGQFGFPGQTGFGVIGHPDHRTIPGAVELAFGTGGEGGALHAEIGATAVQPSTLRQTLFGGIGQQGTQIGAEGVRKADVGHAAVAEETGGPVTGAVDELIGHDHVARLQILLQ